MAPREAFFENFRTGCKILRLTPIFQQVTIIFAWEIPGMILGHLPEKIKVV